MQLNYPTSDFITNILKQVKTDKVPINLILKLLAPLRISNEVDCWFRSDDWSIYSKVDKYLAHRLSYWIFTGKEPFLNREICHKCDRKGCINPEHLFEGTHSNNVKDAIKKGKIFGIQLKKKEIENQLKSENKKFGIKQSTSKIENYLLPDDFSDLS